MLRTVLAGIAVATVASQASAAFFTTRAAFEAAATTSVLEDFEGIDGALLNIQLAGFARNGVTYQPLAGAPGPNVVIAGAPLNYVNFGADIPVVGGSQLTSHVMTASGEEDIHATFDQGYSAVGFDVFHNFLGPTFFRFFDVNGDQIALRAVGNGRNTETDLADIGFVGLTSDTPIWGFRFTTTGGSTVNTGFDNISVAALGPAPIPEPSAWALMIAGFGLGGMMLRAQRGRLALG